MSIGVKVKLTLFQQKLACGKKNLGIAPVLEGKHLQVIV